MDYKYYKSDFNLIVTIGAEYMNSGGSLVTLDNTAHFNFRFYTTDKNNPYICSSTGGAEPVLTNCSKLGTDKVVCHFDRSVKELAPGQLFLEAEFIVPDAKFEGDEHENVVRLYKTDVTLTIDPDKDTEGEFEAMIGADFIKGDPLAQQDITYSELKALRDAGKLVPGMCYRITDFVTTTKTTGTQSAGNQFDIIVQAESAYTLSENARAIRHEGDTYFLRARLEAWQLKYCLDNDTDRFAWADTENGKGVIWYMKDEYGNEAPYDFKNIMFARYKISAMTGTATSLVNQYLGFFDIDNSNVMYPSGATLTGDAVYRYTFDYLTGTTSKDTSIYQASRTSINVHDNEIRSYFPNNQKATKLTNITLGGTSYASCYENKFDANSRNWAIAGEVYGNKVGTNGYNNSVGQSFQYNSVGNNCYNNSVGNWFANNSVGIYFQNNSVGQSFQYNSVGQSFAYNSVGNNCYNNSVGNNCYNNSVGNWFTNNSVGNEFRGNSVGQYFRYNTVENWFANNSVGNGFGSNTVGNCCYNNLIADNIYGINLLDGTSGKHINPVTIEDFDYDYGSWIEGDEDEDGDTLVSGLEGAYFEVKFADEQQHQAHIVVSVKHAGGLIVLADQDITTEDDGTWRIEDLDASWDECKGNECSYSVDIKWADAGYTQRRSGYSDY